MMDKAGRRRENRGMGEAHPFPYKVRTSFKLTQYIPTNYNYRSVTTMSRHKEEGQPPLHVETAFFGVMARVLHSLSGRNTFSTQRTPFPCVSSLLTLRSSKWGPGRQTPVFCHAGSFCPHLHPSHHHRTISAASNNAHHQIQPLHHPQRPPTCLFAPPKAQEVQCSQSDA